MELEVLGRLRLRRDGQDVTPTGGLQRTLLGVLLARANAAVSAGELTGALWGDPPGDRAEARLHVHVHRLRRLLDPDRLTAEPGGGYRLTVLPGELDAERFESLLDAGSALLRDDPERAAELLRTALGCWNGPPYEGLDAPAPTAEAHRLTERHLGGLETYATAELACGRPAGIVPELTEAIRLHPLRERLHGLLMTALYQGGRQGPALAAYRHVRRLLADELGQEPGPELRAIQEAILAGRPIELGATRPVPAPPAQLPHDVRAFAARTAELASLDALLNAGGAPHTDLDGPRNASDPPLDPDNAPLDAGDAPRIAAISGTGGVGKTALALRWAHRARTRFPDGQLFVDLRGYGPEPPLPADEALAGFLRELGVDGTAIPAGTAERAARFRTLVAGRRMLIVLDNARTAEQVRPLLPGSGPSRVVVTSRDALAGLVAREGAHRIRLDRLPAGDALALLGELSGRRVAAEPEAAAELVDRCARLPMALRIAAELINARPHRRVGDLVAELAGGRHTLDVLDAGGDEGTALRAVFSWSYLGLAPATARAFRLLGVYPGHDIDAAAFAALTGNDRATTAAVLDGLLRAGLLDEVTDCRYQAHDLLRAYAADLSGSAGSTAELGDALDRLSDHCLRAASLAEALIYDGGGPTGGEPRDCEEALAWLDSERANLVAIAQHAVASGRPRTATGLAGSLHRHLSLAGHHDQALPLYRAALDGARDLGDPVAEGHAHRHLGAVHGRLGRLAEGLDHMRRAHRCYQRAGHGRSELLQLCNLAVACAWMGRYADAHDHLRRALELSRRLGPEGREGRARALIWLGLLHLFLGDPRKLLEYGREALRYADDTSPRIRIHAEGMIGLAYERLGLDEQALPHLERAVALTREDRTDLLQGYMSALALVYWRLGRPDDAFGHIERCLALTQRSDERTMAAGVRNTFGDLRRLAGAPAEALDHYRAALEVAEAGGVPYDAARAHAGIGDALDDLGETADARAHWRRAVTIFDALGSAESGRVRTRLAPAGSG